MPARLRVSRRSLNAPRARRSVPGCLRRRRLQAFSPPTSRLRLRGVRATRGARSEEITCARHRRHAMVSRASFAFPRGHACRATVRGANAGPSPLAPGCPTAHINLVSQRSQGRSSVVVRDLYRLDCTWLRNHFPKPYYRTTKSQPFGLNVIFLISLSSLGKSSLPPSIPGHRGVQPRCH